MTTPTALPSTGFFAQLMPMLAERTLMLIVSKADDQHLTLSVVPKRMKEGENTARGLFGLFSFALDLGEIIAERNMSRYEIAELRWKIAIQLVGSASATKRCCQRG